MNSDIIGLHPTFRPIGRHWISRSFPAFMNTTGLQQSMFTHPCSSIMVNQSIFSHRNSIHVFKMKIKVLHNLRTVYCNFACLWKLYIIEFDSFLSVLSWNKYRPVKWHVYKISTVTQKVRMSKKHIFTFLTVKFTVDWSWLQFFSIVLS